MSISLSSNGHTKSKEGLRGGSGTIPLATSPDASVSAGAATGERSSPRSSPKSSPRNTEVMAPTDQKPNDSSPKKKSLVGGCTQEPPDPEKQEPGNLQEPDKHTHGAECSCGTAHPVKKEKEDVALQEPPDTSVVDWPAALEQCGGDADFLKEILVDLYNESQENMGQLSSLVSAGDLKACSSIGHSIKGSSANLMCYGMRDAGWGLEKLFHKDKKDVPETRTPEQIQEELEAAYETAQKEVQKMGDLLAKMKITS